MQYTERGRVDGHLDATESLVSPLPGPAWSPRSQPGPVLRSTWGDLEGLLVGFSRVRAARLQLEPAGRRFARHHF